MTLQQDIETFLKTDLYTVAGTAMKLKSAGDVYPDSRTRANRNPNEIKFNVERMNPLSRAVGRAVVVVVNIELFISTFDPYDSVNARIEDILREAAQTITDAYDSWKGAARLRDAILYPIDTVACFEGSYTNRFPESASDPDQSIHMIKYVDLEIHAYEE